MDASQGPQTSFNDLEIPCLLRIFSLLSAEDCARAATVHSLWNSVSGDDAIWKTHASRDLVLKDASNADGSAAKSYRAAYGNWTTAYADTRGPFLFRALAMWAKIKTWLAAHSPQILATLNPGATADEVAKAEADLGHKLPEPVRCIYRICNGQDLKLSERDDPDKPPKNLLMGLFGTLMFYDHITSNAMLSLDAMVNITKLLRSIRPMGARHPLITSTEVVFAHSFKQTDKICLVDAGSGAVSLKLQDRNWPLAPTEDSSPGANDGLLRWMEEYARRLSAGWYGGCESDSMAQGDLSDAGVQVTGAISLFPRVYPAAATAITRGVQVTWSSVFVPQESRLSGLGRLMFTYNVKYQLLTPEQEAAALARLAAEQQQWQQQQQEAGDSSIKAAADQAGSAAGTSQAAAAAAGASPAAAAAAVPKQRLAIGPCDASAGPDCVPPALAVQPAWAAAAAAAGSGSTAAAAAATGPSGQLETLGSATLTSPITSPGSSSGGSSSSNPITTSCQLETRHWSILNNQGTQADSVTGEGVIGLYPLLVPGCEEYSYASCTPFTISGGREGGAAAAAATVQAAAAAGGRVTPQDLVGRVLGGMEGGFDFVEGTIMQRAGPGFMVRCPRLVFAVPEYLY